MPIVSKFENFHILGLQDLSQPLLRGNERREPEVVRGFSAHLAFLILNGEGSYDIVNRLIEYDAPPKTRIFEYTSDEVDCIVMYESNPHPKESNQANLPQAFLLAKSYAEGSRETTAAVLNPKDFQSSYPESFKAIMKTKLGLSVVMDK